MSTQLDRLLSYAESLVGRGEAWQNNAGPFVEWLHRGARRRGNWCAAFVARCIEDVKLSDRIPDRQRRGAKGLTRYLAEGVTSGRWVVRPRWLRAPEHLEAPTAGDVVAWHRGPGRDWTEWHKDWRGHVELVTGYDAETDTLHTLAGNVGRFPAKVHRRLHTNGSWRRKLFGVARLGVLHGEA